MIIPIWSQFMESFSKLIIEIKANLTLGSQALPPLEAAVVVVGVDGCSRILNGHEKASRNHERK